MARALDQRRGEEEMSKVAFVTEQSAVSMEIAIDDYSGPRAR